MDQKWTHWQKIGLKGPAPSLMAWGNGGLFMEMLANKTDPFEYVEKYGNVSGKARRTKRVFVAISWKVHFFYLQMLFIKVRQYFQIRGCCYFVGKRAV